MVLANPTHAHHMCTSPALVTLLTQVFNQTRALADLVQGQWHLSQIYTSTRHVTCTPICAAVQLNTRPH